MLFYITTLNIILFFSAFKACVTFMLLLFSIRFIHIRNPIGDVMVSVRDSSAVYRGFESRLGQIKDSHLYFCASPLNTHQKSKYWLAQCVRVGKHVYPQTVVSLS